MYDKENTLDEVVTVAVAEPETEKSQSKPRRQPPYHVILWDDTDHTFDYVIKMMGQLFRMPREKGYQLAKEVDASGRAICMTTTLELAELKRDQIHSFGRDDASANCKGSMSATIEPAQG